MLRNGQIWQYKLGNRTIDILTPLRYYCTEGGLSHLIELTVETGIYKNTSIFSQTFKITILGFGVRIKS